MLLPAAHNRVILSAVGADDELMLVADEAARYRTAKDDPLALYLHRIEEAHQRGNDTEHTHRPALKALLETLDPRIVATNEPRRVACGAPDFAIARRSDALTLGYVEAKDIGAALDEIEKSEQLKRYRDAFPNLLLTDYVEFRWFINGERRGKFRLARSAASGKLSPDYAAFADAERALRQFLDLPPIRITGAEELARRLARLTHLIRDVIAAAFRTGGASELMRSWRDVFARTLLPELADDGKEAEFADMFAQTVAYGLFSARAMGSASARFTLAEAARLIPKTNPFLRDFFDLITGPRLEDEPFAGFVRDLVSLLDHADMVAILEDFGKGGAARRDPVVHFYETFLQAYDPALRELRGVYYTPEPVVSYIVGSVDELLREKLGVKDGLSDKSKTTFQRAVGGKTETEECHRVLILDPAAGTGTFLFEVIERIREQFDRRHQAGLWPSYVREHLLPRLFGFELLMAPYAVAHFKIALELSARHLPELFREQWAYHFADNERLNIYLTNTLEDIEHATQQFGPLAILSKEANEATAVKKHRPVLVVLGNPPYSNYGRQNRNPWILGLLDDYKRGLKEKKLNLDDDFIKFLRWAHWRIERTGSGIVGFITNNVYLDGLTHRRLRESLLETFDEIHVLNLHGSSKKQETAPGGAKDENVFDITVGVAIVLLVKRPAAAKRGKKGTHAAVFHADLWGRRAAKYDWLWKHDVHNTQWTRLEPAKPDFLFVPRDTRHEAEYNAGWSLRDIFPVGNNGLKTDRDELFFDFDRKALERRMQTFFSDDRPAMFDHDYRVQDFSSYDIAARRAKCGYNPKAVQRCLYRPFDTRWLYYDPGLTSRPAEKVMKHILGGENVGLIAARQTKDDFGVLATASLAGHKSCAAYDINTVFPLYLYPDGRVPDDLFAHANGRRPNLAAAFVAEMERRLGMKFVADGPGNLKKTFGPEDVFHYLYAVLHSPRYRERYAEFLRTDFPRIPLTDKRCLFVRLCGRGKELVALHLLREDGPSLASFPVPGDARVEFVTYVPPEADLSAKERGEFAAEKLAPGRDGRVFINPRQYFEGVCPAIWQMRVGGYQVCERWLKDRRSRALTHDELDHYTRVVNALAETRRVMVEIDAVIADCGGWPLR